MSKLLERMTGHIVSRLRLPDEAALRVAPKPARSALETYTAAFDRLTKTRENHAELEKEYAAAQDADREALVEATRASTKPAAPTADAIAKKLDNALAQREVLEEVVRREQRALEQALLDGREAWEQALRDAAAAESANYRAALDTAAASATAAHSYTQTIDWLTKSTVGRGVQVYSRPRPRVELPTGAEIEIKKLCDFLVDRGLFHEQTPAERIERAARNLRGIA